MKPRETKRKYITTSAIKNKLWHSINRGEIGKSNRYIVVMRDDSIAPSKPLLQATEPCLHNRFYKLQYKEVKKSLMAL